MARREYRQLSLKDSIEYQKRQFPTMKCHDCGGEQKIVHKPHPKFGITVWDYPMYECPECGAKSFTASVSIAVQEIQKKHNLHGGWYIQDLLEVEENKSEQSN